MVVGYYDVVSMIGHFIHDSAGEELLNFFQAKDFMNMIGCKKHLAQKNFVELADFSAKVLNHSFCMEKVYGKSVGVAIGSRLPIFEFFKEIVKRLLGESMSFIHIHDMVIGDKLIDIKNPDGACQVIVVDGEGVCPMLKCALVHDSENVILHITFKDLETFVLNVVVSFTNIEKAGRCWFQKTSHEMNNFSRELKLIEASFTRGWGKSLCRSIHVIS